MFSVSERVETAPAGVGGHTHATAKVPSIGRSVQCVVLSMLLRSRSPWDNSRCEVEGHDAARGACSIAKRNWLDVHWLAWATFSSISALRNKFLFARRPASSSEASFRCGPLLRGRRPNIDRPKGGEMVPLRLMSCHVRRVDVNNCSQATR